MDSKGMIERIKGRHWLSPYYVSITVFSHEPETIVTEEEIKG
jgi:hypothetical protein